MAKMRGIKPDFWTDDDLIECSPLARLLFIGLWTQMCDNGHCDDKPKQLKLRILPSDDCDVDRLLDELAEHGVIVRMGGYVKAPNLPAHQRIDKRYLALCQWCSHDPDAVFTEADRPGRKP